MHSLQGEVGDVIPHIGACSRQSCTKSRQKSHLRPQKNEVKPHSSGRNENKRQRFFMAAAVQLLVARVKCNQKCPWGPLNTKLV